MSGDIATWIVASIIAICFILGLKKMYTNFSSGKCDLVAQMVHVLVIAIL